jgi:1,4-alpha-glucan branching enzyme
MWAHPGKQLLFMGGELAQEREWDDGSELDWQLLELPDHAGVQALVRELNRIHATERALYVADSSPDGFRWIDATDSDANVLSFLRVDPASDRRVACVANLSPVPRHGYRIGLPRAGPWVELLNTDAAVFGGSNVGNGGAVIAEREPFHGQPASVLMTLPPLSVLWLVPA